MVENDIKRNESEKNMHINYRFLDIKKNIIFYIIYFFEWLWRVLFTKNRFSHKAYRNISFEQEAYKNEMNLLYLATRNHFEQWKIY